jgi:hypothetical protein
MDSLMPELPSIPALVAEAAGSSPITDPERHVELQQLYQQIRQEFAPLAFLYDLRTHSGFAHPGNLRRASDAAVALGLPANGWNRANYLALISLVTDAIEGIANHFARAVSSVLDGR